MDIFDPLSTIAEYSIGLAGFTGIIAAVANFSKEKIELEEFRFTNLLFTAFAPGFFSLIAICLLYLDYSNEMAIRISSGLLTLYLCTWGARVIRNKPADFGGFFYRSMWTLTIANISMQVAIVTTVLANPTGYFLASLVLLLFQGAAIFSQLALATFKAHQ